MAWSPRLSGTCSLEVSVLSSAKMGRNGHHQQDNCSDIQGLHSRSWDIWQCLLQIFEGVQDPSHTWYYNVSELCHSLYVKLEVDKHHNIKPVQQEKQSMIDVAMEKGYRGKTPESTSINQKYRNLMFFSKLILYNGKKIA